MIGRSTVIEMVLLGLGTKILEDCLSLVEGSSGFSNSASDISEPQYVSFTKLDTELIEVLSLLLVGLFPALTKCSTLPLSFREILSEKEEVKISEFSISQFSIKQGCSRLLVLWKLLFSSSLPRKVTLVFTLPTENDESLGFAGSKCDLAALRLGVHHGSVLAVIELSLDSSSSFALQ